MSAASRALIATAVASVVVYAFGTASLGTPPGAAATGDEVVTWFQVYADGVRRSVWAGAVAAPLLAIALALLRRLLPAPHRDVFLFGAVALVVASSVQSWFWGGLALHADRLEPATARIVLDVALFWGPVLTGATMTMLAPVTLLAFRGEAGLPRWLGVLGAIVFIEQAIETITIFGSTGFTEPGGAMNLQLGAGLFIVWLLAFAIWGSRHGSFEAGT